MKAPTEDSDKVVGLRQLNKKLSDLIGFRLVNLTRKRRTHENAAKSVGIMGGTGTVEIILNESQKAR